MQLSWYIKLKLRSEWVCWLTNVYCPPGVPGVPGLEGDGESHCDHHEGPGVPAAGGDQANTNGDLRTNWQTDGHWRPASD